MRSRAILVAAFVALSGASAPAQTGMDELLAQAAKWEGETSRKPLQAIFEMTRNAQGAERRGFEQKFLAFLQSDATLASKEFICKQLSLIGSEASVPVLSRLLPDPKTSDMARFALQRIPGAAVDKALREALGKTTGKPRIGVINTLGERRDAGSVALLKPLALGGQPAEASAALSALARIADAPALRVLEEAQSKSTGPVHAAAAEAWLQAAIRLTERGDKAGALPIFKKLYATSDPATVRAAALRGLALAGGAQATPMLKEALHGSDLRLQAIAVNSDSGRNRGTDRRDAEAERGRASADSRPAVGAARCRGAARVHRRSQELQQAGSIGSFGRHRSHRNCRRVAGSRIHRRRG